MQEKIKALRAAFPLTVPVMVGYLFLGAAFGILLQSKGYGFGWAVLMSVFIYAGSMQFVAVGLLSSGASLISAAVMTLMVNIRHTFYGLSMLDKYKDMGARKPYVVFSLTDETFSLVCSAKVSEGVNEKDFLAFISLLNQIYWVIGSAVGGLLGSAFSFDTKGIDFSMTALFIVIFLNQWKTHANRLPAFAGISCSIFCLLIFGPAKFILPAMLLIALVLSLCRRRLGNGEGGMST